MCCKKNFLSYISEKKCLYSTYSSFLVIGVCNQGNTLCSPCICASALVHKGKGKAARERYEGVQGEVEVQLRSF